MLLERKAPKDINLDVEIIFDIEEIQNDTTQGVNAPAGIWTRVTGSKGPYTCPGYTTGAVAAPFIRVYAC